MANFEQVWSRDVAATVEMYVSSRLRSQRPVSTEEAIVAIRAALPRCDLDDRALADLIANFAIRNRQNVIFDDPAEDGQPRS